MSMRKNLTKHRSIISDQQHHDGRVIRISRQKRRPYFRIAAFDLHTLERKAVHRHKGSSQFQ